MDDVRDRVDDVRDRVASVPHMSMPRLQEVGRQADQTVDRFLGRPARRSWLKPLLVIGVLGVMAAVAAMAMSWSRNRPSRLTDEDAIDEMALDVTSGESMPGMAGFATATVVETGTIGLSDELADVD
jgi:hypothetical protein